VANGVVYAGNLDHSVYGFDAATGAVLWQHETGFEVRSSPAVVNGMVFIGSEDHSVYAFGLPG
jgi:serine/threonine-protein kinase